MLQARQQNEHGDVLVILLVCAAVIVVLYFGLVAMLWWGVTSGTIGGGKSGLESFSGIDGRASNAPPGTDKGSTAQAGDAGELDSGSAELVCVRLNGVGGGKTPALDRRVAPRLVAAMSRMAADGITGISFTWGLRTTCQQMGVNPGTNLKARPGSSPHEAGSAVDMNGMRTRGDRGRIIQIMNQHDFVWLGRRDPPHFHVQPSTVGEANWASWIRKIQHLYQTGQPATGCRRPECGS